MARFLLLLTVFSSTLAFSIPNHGEHLTGKELVDFINSKQTLFKAELSHFTMKEMQMRAMKGEHAVFNRDPSATVAEEIQINDDEIPESFDSRTQWPNCASIKKIWDQSNCGSCWAFSSSEVMSDRTCIATGNQVIYSPADVMSCCTHCGNGCDGGNPQKALTYWFKTGVVTGGDYGSTDDCKAYPFHPCGYHGQNYTSCPDNYSTPKCLRLCQQGYPTPYQQDKHYGANAYYVQRSVAAIQKEIMTYGPVNGCYSLYEDFYQYKSGIYVHTGGKYIGGHCVKTIGWGTENGTPYWIVANSWNSDWGENGYFRIIRGTNEVGFEDYISGGHARV